MCIRDSIYTAITAGFVISFLGGSRVQIAGPTAAFATIVAGIVAKNGMDGLIIATLLAGVIQMCIRDSLDPARRSLCGWSDERNRARPQPQPHGADAFRFRRRYLL